MTIPYCIQIGDTVVDESEVEATILAVFSEINQVYNHWNPDSELSKLNRLAAHQTVLLSPQLAAFLHSVDTMVTLTEGRFDPTVEPLQSLWKTHLKEGQLPPQEKIDDLKLGVGWQTIHLVDRLFWKDFSQTSIDLGGIAKGYAVDLLIEKLHEVGFQQIYVEWGGEIRTLGNHPSGRPWNIGIYGSSSLTLQDLAIATSGSYIQQWTVDRTTYTHIMDPCTKEPLHNAAMTSVSVIAPTCQEADAIATALMLFPSKEAAEKWATERNYQVYIW